MKSDKQNERLYKEILKGLKVLSENDRDVQTLTVWCNPNFKYGADRDIRAKILEILKVLEEKGIISKKKKKIQIYGHGQRLKEFELWSLK